MSSGRIIKIRLHPFYQDFMKSQFGQNSPVFEMPERHDLTTRLETYLSEKPANAIIRDFGDQNFLISIPKMEHKDPDIYNYLNPKKISLFEDRIINYFRDVFHDAVTDLRQQGYLREEIFEIIKDDWKISFENNDMLLREYSRYLEMERKRRFRKKLKKHVVEHKKNFTKNACQI